MKQQRELYEGGGMPHRSSVDKGKAAKKFNHQSQRTKAANLGQTPGVMRGGIRL